MNLISILTLTANPLLSHQPPLQSDAEVRLFEEALPQSQYSDYSKVTTQLAARPTALHQSLLDDRSQIVHFSGYGTGDQRLKLEAAPMAKAINLVAQTSAGLQ